MPQQRNLSVDLFKLLAATGVILIHLGPSTPAAEAMTRPFLSFAVPFFLTISLYYFREIKWDRLLVPYVTWSILYAGVQYARIWLGGPHHIIDTVGVIFFGGGAIHLYFLPLLVLFQAQALLLKDWKYLPLAGGIMLIGYVGSSELYFGMGDALKIGWIYVGLAFLLSWTQSVPLGRAINLVVGVVTAGVVIRVSPTGWWQSPLIGYGAAALALNVRVAAVPGWLKQATGYSFGIYLAHFAFIQGFQMIGQISGPYTITTKLCMCSLILTTCVGLVVVTCKAKLAGYLIFGVSPYCEPVAISPNSRKSVALMEPV